MRQWKAALLFQEVQVSEELWQKCPSTSSDPDSEPQESISEIKRDDQRESDLNISPHAGDARKTSLDDGLKDGHSATEPPSMTCRMQTSPHEDEDEQLPGTSQVLQDNPNLSTAAVVANNAMAFLHKWIETGSNMEAIVSRIQAEPSSQGQLSIVTTLYEQLKKYVHIDLKRMDLIIEGCQRDWEALQLVEQQQQEALQLKEEQQREALQLMEQQQQHALQLEEEQQRKALQSKEQRQRELESSLKSI
ncbi:MAG: hypothetical protein M1828_001599 [Chrysothrix sp. TS-e1954]|nr:MAG: hypothetical protein M1828_001599 [Chrysothrix sp. TS-e1954]